MKNKFLFSKTPYRISLFGGGSDYPKFYKDFGGACIGGSIDKYCYIGARALPSFFEHKYRIVYSKTELPQTVSDIKHPAVREVLKFLEISEGLEIHHYGDLPARSGLGTSSAFTVGMLNLMSTMEDNPLAKEDLYEKSIFIEQNRIKEAVGSQDQVMVARGGFNFVEFGKNGSIRCDQSFNKDRIKKLSENLLLFYTGVSRNSHLNASKIIDNIPYRLDALTRMVQLAHEAKDLIQSNHNLNQIGEMLNEAWMIKRSLADSISTELIDELYEKAMSAGALGGKILGAGGGGFLLFYAPKNTHSNIINNLKEYLHIDFNFEFQGSHILDNFGGFSE